MRTPKVGRLIAAHLRRQIVSGELEQGDALPSEAELMKQFEVSRPPYPIHVPCLFDWGVPESDIDALVTAGVVVEAP